MSISNFMETQLLGQIPSPCYISLHTADPGENGTTALVPSSTRLSATLAAASGNSRSTNSVVLFSAWAWGTQTITHIAVWDAVTAGNCVWTGALTASKVVNNGDSLSFASGAITFTLD